MSEAQIPLPGDQIRSLIEDLKAQRAEAEERIAEIDATLPGLQKIAEGAARREMSEAAPASDPRTSGDMAPAAVQPPAGRVQIKRARDVQQQVAKIAAGLPERCELSEIETALAADGFKVNQSTLRKNLTDMVRMGKVFKIAVEGKGRRATIFEKI